MYPAIPSPPLVKQTGLCGLMRRLAIYPVVLIALLWLKLTKRKRAA